MELTTIFLIWLAIVIADNFAKRKKRRLPPPQNDSPDFDIPTLANDPNLPGEEIPIFIESPQQVEVRPREVTSPRPQHSQKISEQIHDDELDLNLTPTTVRNTIVLAELLDKPKALRRRRR